MREVPLTKKEVRESTCPICKVEKASVLRTGDSGLFLVNYRDCGVAFKVDRDVMDQFDRYLRNKWDRDELKRIIAAENDRDEFPKITTKFLMKFFGDVPDIFDRCP